MRLPTYVCGIGLEQEGPEEACKELSANEAVELLDELRGALCVYFGRVRVLAAAEGALQQLKNGLRHPVI